MKHFILLISLIQLFNLNLEAQVTGKYFGQNPPGMTPEIFSPNFISTEEWEAAGTFSPNGTEYFFTRRPTEEGRENRIYYTKMIDSIWSVPKLAPFSTNTFEIEPHIIPTGNIIYFTSEKSKPNSTKLKGEIWYSEKINNEWRNSKYLVSCINDFDFNMNISVANNGTIYFTGLKDGNYGIYSAKKGQNGFEEPIFLPEQINNLPVASHPFIDPNEKFLLFDAQITGTAKPEIFISFRKKDGSWTEAKNLGAEINKTKTEFGASVSPDGKYLFFHRTLNGNGDIYWVDAKILNQFK